MPSGKTHDAITWILAVPTYLATYYWTGSWGLAGMVTLATVFSGLMFGPDLDIRSKQYNRWGPLRFLWWPYQKMMPHRSRLSHGIVLGPAVRIIYFLAIAFLLVLAASYLRASVLGGEPLGTKDLARYTPHAESYALWLWSQKEVWAILAGLWWGAATHTLSDMSVTIVRKVSEIF